ncbi:MAG TPA: coproporphyrinogen III oxidase, partial [Chitinophaga sp.]
ISDSWNAYAQNEKHIPAWQETVKKGLLPVVRGHALTGEDMRLRNHIQSLMCRLETSLNRADAHCNAVMEGMGRLRELEKDGLVALLPGKIQVTEEGRPFIRNICMAFDARLWRKAPQSQLFSQAI